MRYCYCIAGGAVGKVEIATRAAAPAEDEGADSRPRCKGQSPLRGKRLGNNRFVDSDSTSTNYGNASCHDGSTAQASDEHVFGNNTTNNGHEHGASVGSNSASVSASPLSCVLILLATYLHTSTGTASLQGLDNARIDELKSSV